MMTSLNAQEIHFLEKYSSAQYFCELRDAWGVMVEHVEYVLEKFVHSLPLDYRNRPLPEQPDVVWGEQVLPNFRDTYQSLCDGLVMLSNGDFNGLACSNGPMNDFKGQREFWAEWMEPIDLQKYYQLLLFATTLAKNIVNTLDAQWRPGDLSYNYDDNARGPADIPSILPNYKMNRTVTVATGDHPAIAGIYLPDIDDSCAEFIVTQSDKAPGALVFVKDEVLLHPTTGVQYGTRRIYEEKPCTWTLVERDQDAKAISKLMPLTGLRIGPGANCPQTGFYFSPAREFSRRHFTKGEMMPNFENDYGLVIWQWDLNQS